MAAVMRQQQNASQESGEKPQDEQMNANKDSEENGEEEDKENNADEGEGNNEQEDVEMKDAEEESNENNAEEQPEERQKEGQNDGDATVSESHKTSENLDDHRNQESTQKLAQKTVISVEKMQQLKLMKTFHADAIKFIQQIHSAIPIIAQLLSSKSKPEVLEAMDFFVTAHDYKIKPASVRLLETIIRNQLLTRFIERYTKNDSSYLDKGYQRRRKGH